MDCQTTKKCKVNALFHLLNTIKPNASDSNYTRLFFFCLFVAFSVCMQFMHRRFV